MENIFIVLSTVLVTALICEGRKRVILKNKEKQYSRKTAVLEKKITESNEKNENIKSEKDIYFEKVRELNRELITLNKDIRILNLRKDQLEKLKNDLNDENKKLKSELNKSSNANSQQLENLIKDISEKESIIAELKNKIRILEENEKSFKEELENNELVIVEEKDETNEETKTSIEEVSTAINIGNTKLNEYEIESTEEVLFNLNLEDINKSLEKIKDLESLKNHLAKSEHKDKAMYEKAILKYEKEILKMISKLDIDEDDDEISEEITTKLFKIVEMYLINRIMVSVYRGKSKENCHFYKTLLNEINEYLKKIKVYTRPVNINEKIKEEDYIDMEIYAKKTDNNNLHNIIEEVEKLPYYINYIENDEVEKYVIKGYMIVYSNKI